MKHEKFMLFLKEHGWEVASSDYWNDYNRIILKKGDISFPLQYKEVYYFPLVVRTCISLEIDPPPDHLRCYEQLESQKKKDEEERNKGNKSHPSSD
jgi:hypothetical protein